MLYRTVLVRGVSNYFSLLLMSEIIAHKYMILVLVSCTRSGMRFILRLIPVYVCTWCWCQSPPECQSSLVGREASIMPHAPDMLTARQGYRTIGELFKGVGSELGIFEPILSPNESSPIDSLDLLVPKPTPN